jgi:hypothetical protein
VVTDRSGNERTFAEPDLTPAGRSNAFTVLTNDNRPPEAVFSRTDGGSGAWSRTVSPGTFATPRSTQPATTGHLQSRSTPTISWVVMDLAGNPPDRLQFHSR